VGGRYDVRVLEPSPPAVADPPYFADDPVSGGEVVPVERPGSTSWSQLCRQEDDAGLLSWCQDRWLVRRPLVPLPEGFAETRTSLHAVAEHLLAPARHAANGKIGLRFTYHGFGTPFFADDRQLRVEDGVLVDGDRRLPLALTALGEAAAFLGTTTGAPESVYRPSTPYDSKRALTVEPAAARALGDWYGFCASVLEQLRAEAVEADAPARVQLWPEHFDLGIRAGEVNYGASPGDAQVAEPYVYVGPTGLELAATGDGFWNQPFGATMTWEAIGSVQDALDFFRQGHRHAAG
jgi:hypothetical protein